MGYIAQDQVTLADFLLARIAEDEAVAKAAADDQSHRDGDGMHWRGSEDGDVYEGDSGSYVACGPWESNLGVTGLHIARHDPARVLAECEAKRRIVAEHRVRPNGQCWTCAGEDRAEGAQWPCETVRLLALPHSDHPDYRQGWKP